jgi:hypothetical protein
MGLEVKEVGESECHPVTGWIGFEPISNINPRESEQTSNWSLITRSFIEPFNEKNANVDASWCILNTRLGRGKKMPRESGKKTVERLQASIVKASDKKKSSRFNHKHDWVPRGSSVVPGNRPAAFLGELAVVIPPAYPTSLDTYSPVERLPVIPKN